MATNNRYVAPKQWSLCENETLNSFESWRNNLVYTLKLDTRFDPFIRDDFTWLKKSCNAADTCGLVNDPLDDGVAGLTAAAKCAHLDMLLGQIANFAPIISRRQIVNDSTYISAV